MSSNGGIQDMEAQEHRRRASTPSCPDSAIRAFGCTFVCKILPGSRSQTVDRALESVNSQHDLSKVRQNLASKSFHGMRRGYNQPWLPESAFLRGTFPRISSYFLVKAELWASTALEAAFSYNQRPGSASNCCGTWSGSFVPRGAGEEHGNGRSN